MDVNKILAATGLFVNSEEDQTQDQSQDNQQSVQTFYSANHPKMTLSVDESKVDSSYQQLVADKLQQALFAVSTVYSKYIHAYDVLEKVPFPDDTLRIQAALASAGLTASDIVNALQNDFLTILHKEKTTFATEIKNKFEELDNQHKIDLTQLTTEKHRLEAELLKVNDNLQAIKDRKLATDSNLNAKVKFFDLAFTDIESKIKETISILTTLK